MTVQYPERVYVHNVHSIGFQTVVFDFLEVSYCISTNWRVTAGGPNVAEGTRSQVLLRSVGQRQIS